MILTRYLWSTELLPAHEVMSNRSFGINGSIMYERNPK